MDPVAEMESLRPLIRENAREMIHGLREAWPMIADGLRAASPDGTLIWHLQAAGLALLCVGLGLIAMRQTMLGTRRLFRGIIFNPHPRSRTEKIGYLWLRVIIMGLGVATMALVAFVAATVLGLDAPAFQVTFLAVLGTAVEVSIVWIVFLGLLAPDAGSHRMLPFDDEVARRLFRRVLVIIAIIMAAVELSFWLRDIGLPPALHKAALIVSALVAATLLAGLAILHRQDIAAALLGPEPAKRDILLRVLSRNWHVPTVLYFLGAFVVTTANLLLDRPVPLAPVVLPIMILFSGFGLYGLALMTIDALGARLSPLRRLDPPEETATGPAGSGTPRGLHELAEQAARIAILVAGVILLLETWNISGVVGVNPVLEFMDVLIVIFLAWLAYQAVRILIDRRIAEEGGFEQAEPGEEGGAAAAASRLATLLPLFRNVVLITVASIGAMIALAELGVDVAPLFAGAGVIGLAIGFGAQTLIRDIFSGAFFLIDDAFRKGEYIDLGGVKGTVEKISLRSMQLRHHLGALHTVPFGEIKQLTNYSRDWAMMKLTLRLTYDTDVEKVRKLIKDLGKRLTADPEIGHKFLQPLKSQGVYAMEDSAMLVRVKFMTKPGDQFVIRKRVYQDIRDLFEAEGIIFAHREVTVRLAGEGAREPDPKMISGAVLPAIEDQVIAASGPNPAEAR